MCFLKLITQGVPHRRTSHRAGATAERAEMASSYLGSGRMTEVIRLALYTEVLGPWDGDCAGGRPILSTDTGLADLLPLGVLNTSALSTSSSYG